MESDAGVTRREFVKLAAATSIAVGAGSLAWATEKEGGMPYRILGRTGEKVCHRSRRLSHRQTGRCDGGASEIRMGKALRGGYRDKVFLRTKIDGRTKDSAAPQIDESLERLQTDCIDLMQFHEVIRMEDPDRIFAEGGAVEAIQAAKQAGKIRYIGFTGHKDPSVHLRMLDIAANHNFRFDAVQMPLNVMDAHFRSFEHEVLPLLLKDEIGVIAMKALADC
jgi:aryl-alcohol dehydrogenase-like predicted oxidoreductase